MSYKSTIDKTIHNLEFVRHQSAFYGHSAIHAAHAATLDSILVASLEILDLYGTKPRSIVFVSSTLHGEHPAIPHLLPHFEILDQKYQTITMLHKHKDEKTHQNIGHMCPE